MADYSLQGLNITAGDFLGAFFAPLEIVRLRIFSDRPNTVFAGHKLDIELANFEQLAETLRQHNSNNRGVYFVINHGGHEDSQIDRINAQFMEMDDIPLEEQLAKIKAFPIEPSLIVKTRKSLHCYWLMKNAQTERFRHIQKQLVAHFGADPACINESRVFRLPTFYHCKEEPVMVECIKFNPELRYTQEQLTEVLPTISQEPNCGGSAASVKEHGGQKGLLVFGRKCAFIKHCKRNAKSLSEPDWYAMITNLAVFEGGEEAIHKLSKPYPKYSFEKTQAKIDHFRKSGTKPMTCRSIAEKGFECPKLETCGNKCKSPAALAYFPMEIGEIRKRLESVKSTNNTMDNIETARSFINDYLYNMETGLADSFINSEIKQKFNFKAVDLKQLVSFHKEVSRVFFSEQQSKRNSNGEELPSWYELSDKGKLRFMPSVLADYCATNEHVFYCADSYYFYENGVYLPQNDDEAENRIRQHMALDRYKTSSQISDAEHQWRIQINKPFQEINPNPYLINFKNGMYNILTDELSEHTPNIYSTIQLNGDYTTNVECPIFLDYLDGVLPKSEHPLIQEILGYLLAAINKAQKCFVLVGKKDSGKSTLLNLVHTLLGGNNFSTLPWQSLDDRFSTHQLFGKLVNIFADLPSKNLKDTGMFKAITGEDYITGERKHKDPFSFKPITRILFTCNTPPRNYSDRSDAFYGRLIMIKFDNTIPKEKQDKSLKAKLVSEVDGILAWALIGLKRLIANNYVFSETDRTESERRQYMTENSKVLMFVNECCVLDRKVWKKVNPSYGITVDPAGLRAEFEDAKLSPANENKFRRLNLNQWVKQFTRWMPMDKWDKCGFDINMNRLRGRDCYGGLDLSTTEDMTAFVLVFPPDDIEDEEDKFTVLPFFWIPEDSMHKRVIKDKVPYDNWVKTGLLKTTDSAVINYNYIQEELESLREIYRIKEIAYDRWGAGLLRQNLENARFKMIDFGQGMKDM